MTVLGRSEITKLVKEYKMIYPFDLALLDGDSYILTVKEEVTIPYLSHRNVVAYEVVFMPLQYTGRLSIKSKYGRLGLFFSGAVSIHSGWIGRPVLELLNANDQHLPVTIKRGDPFIHLHVHRREGEPWPYSGGYQFQEMNGEERELFKPFMKKNWEKAGLNFEQYLGRYKKRIKNSTSSKF